jgi:SnoaL-like domain
VSDLSQRWHGYANCWSAEPEQRAGLLPDHVTDDVTYRDPGTEVAGRPALSGYMEGFRDGFPGNRFVIDHVDTHHERSLAHWRQVDDAGTTVLTGASVARHAPDGRLADITGFFLGPPA